MSESEVHVSGGGIGLCGLLTVLFVGLKLTGNVDWSWLWVLAPLWIPWVVVFAMCAAVLGCFLIIAAGAWLWKRFNH